MLKKIQREKTWVVGLLQALLVAVYCALIATTFSFLTKIFPKDPPGLSPFFLMMLLFVFSATITALFVFGFPSYLVVAKGKVKEAARILAFTLLFLLLIIIVTIVFLLAVLA